MGIAEILKGLWPKLSSRPEDEAGITLSKPIWIDCYHDYDSHLYQVLPLFTKKHRQVNIKIVAQVHEDHHRKLASNFTTRSGAGDLVFVDVAKLGSLINTGELECLDPYLAGVPAFRSQFPAYSTEQGMGADGKTYAIPVDIGPGVLFYVKRHFHDLGVDIAEVTRSWDHFLEFGTKLRRDRGVALLSNASEIADLIVNATVADGEGIYFDKDGKCLLLSPRYLEAFALARRARERGLDLRVPPWSPAWRDLVREAKVATLLSGAWMLGHLKNSIAPKSAKVWAVSHLPNGIYGSWGGSFLAIPRQSKHQETAWKLIEFLTSPSVQLLGLRNIGAFPANRLTYTQDVFDEGIPYLDNQKAYPLFAEISGRISPVKTHKADQIAYSIYKNALQEVIEQGQDIRAALESAEQELLRRLRIFS